MNDRFMFVWLEREKLERREINKCPATIFADSRTDRVIGRIRFLTVSIRTIKFIRGVGVPMGVMWISICLGVFVHPFKIVAIQSVKDKIKVTSI